MQVSVLRPAVEQVAEVDEEDAAQCDSPEDVEETVASDGDGWPGVLSCVWTGPG